MKTIVKRLARDEKGAALVMVLILLLISGLIIGPLLSYMGTGLITGEVYETRTAELYAADAGAEDAIWRIQNGKVSLCPGQPIEPPFSINVNGKSVTVYIEYVGEGTYRINSIAITDDGGGTAAITGTEIEAYVTADIVSGNYSGLLDNVITSLNEITLLGQNIDIIAEGHEPHGYYPEDEWLTREALRDFYWPDVKDAVPYYDSDTLDVEDYAEIGPLYRNGTLDIINSGADGLTLSLNGTVYITGDTEIGKTGGEFTLDLKGNTIFVDSDTAGSQKALWIGKHCKVEGPGVMIAIGDIELQPSYSMGSEAGPVFIFSVSGSTTLRPGAQYGELYGAIAGNVTVLVQSGKEVMIKYPDDEGWYAGLNFPIGTPKPEQLVYSIASWEVIPLWRE